MKTPRQHLVAGLALALSCGAFAADSTPAPPAASAGDATTSRPAASAGLLSERLAAEVRAGLPAYTPPKEPEGTADELEVPEGVILLPKVIVREPKLPAPLARDFLTKRGLAEYLRKRYPGASLPGQDPVNSMLPNYASLMDREDRRLEQKRGFEDFTAAVRRLPGTRPVDDLEREIDRAFMRRPDARTESMEKSVNWGRR